MCELPGQTVDDFEKTLKYAVHLPVTHMSVYSLILEEGTRFSQMASRAVFWRVRQKMTVGQCIRRCVGYFLITDLSGMKFPVLRGQGFNLPITGSIGN